MSLFKSSRHLRWRIFGRWVRIGNLYLLSNFSFVLTHHKNVSRKSGRRNKLWLYKKQICLFQILIPLTTVINIFNCHSLTLFWTFSIEAWRLVAFCRLWCRVMGSCGTMAWWWGEGGGRLMITIWVEFCKGEWVKICTSNFLSRKCIFQQPEFYKCENFPQLWWDIQLRENFQEDFWRK